MISRDRVIMVYSEVEQAPGAGGLRDPARAEVLSRPWPTTKIAVEFTLIRV